MKSSWNRPLWTREKHVISSFAIARSRANVYGPDGHWVTQKVPDAALVVLTCYFDSKPEPLSLLPVSLYCLPVASTRIHRFECFRNDSKARQTHKTPLKNVQKTRQIKPVTHSPKSVAVAMETFLFSLLRYVRRNSKQHGTGWVDEVTRKRDLYQVWGGRVLRCVRVPLVVLAFSFLAQAGERHKLIFKWGKIDFLFPAATRCAVPFFLAHSVQVQPFSHGLTVSGGIGWGEGEWLLVQ